MFKFLIFFSNIAFPHPHYLCFLFTLSLLVSPSICIFDDFFLKKLTFNFADLHYYYFVTMPHLCSVLHCHLNFFFFLPLHLSVFCLLGFKLSAFYFMFFRISDIYITNNFPLNMPYAALYILFCNAFFIHLTNIFPF